MQGRTTGFTSQDARMRRALVPPVRGPHDEREFDMMSAEDQTWFVERFASAARRAEQHFNLETVSPSHLADMFTRFVGVQLQPEILHRALLPGAGITPPYRENALGGSTSKRIGAGERDLGDVRFDYGREVFGPILTEYVVTLWAYLHEASRAGQTVALFCARGGLVMREIYERALSALGLTSPVRHEAFMISRVVAARGALLKGGEIARREIAREFSTETLANVASALADLTPPSDAFWDQPVTFDSVGQLLDDDRAQEFRSVLSEQDALLTRHIVDVVGEASNLVLVDTGLYGSTLRLLQEGRGELNWTSVQLARANYKGFCPRHFDRIYGVFVERDSYCRRQVRTAILRYWQLVEWLMEPKLKSAKWFELRDGVAWSNLQEEDWQDRIRGNDNPVLRGALSFLDTLTKDELGRVPEKLEASWRRLRRDILFPDRNLTEILNIDNRSRDFGRSTVVSNYVPGTRSPVRAALWRHGAVRSRYGVLGTFLNYGLEAYYHLRRRRKRTN